MFLPLCDNGACTFTLIDRIANAHGVPTASPYIYRGTWNPHLTRFSMRAIRYYGPGDIRLEEIPEPQVGEKQIKIKVCYPRFISLFLSTDPSEQVAW